MQVGANSEDAAVTVAGLVAPAGGAGRGNQRSGAGAGLRRLAHGCLPQATADVQHLFKVLGAVLVPKTTIGLRDGKRVASDFAKSAGRSGADPGRPLRSQQVGYAVVQ